MAHIRAAQCREMQALINEERFAEMPRLVCGDFNTAFPSAHIKSACEALCYSYFKEYKVDVKIARLFETYGCGMTPDDQRIIPRMVVAALRNSDIIIRDTKGQLRTFCWVGDIVRGITALAERTEKNHAIIITDTDCSVAKEWGLGDCNNMFIIMIVTKEGELVYCKKGELTKEEQEEFYQIVDKYR